MQELQSNGVTNGEGGLLGDESGPQEESRRGRAFLTSLVRELFQTERSAMIHPRIEAERLGDVPPAHAMRAVSTHAEAALAEIRPLLRERGLPISAGGSTVGEAFSALRDHLADYLLSTERSYRGTLLGMRHGVDLVELLQYVATVEGEHAPRRVVRAVALDAQAPRRGGRRRARVVRGAPDARHAGGEGRRRGPPPPGPRERRGARGAVGSAASSRSPVDARRPRAETARRRAARGAARGVEAEEDAQWSGGFRRGARRSSS